MRLAVNVACMEEKIFENLCYKNVKEGEHLRYPDVYWRIILKTDFDAYWNKEEWQATIKCEAFTA